MPACSPCATDQQFDIRAAGQDLRRFHRHGPDPSTRLLLAAIHDSPLPQAPDLLDIGGGIGVIHHVLLNRGFAQATEVDASTASLEVAAEESRRRGHADRVMFRHGNFRGIESTIGMADVVTLDRVVCCDSDYAILLGAAAAHARWLVAFTYPRPRWFIKAFVAGMNLWRHLRGQSFRAYVHSPNAMFAVLRRSGFRQRWTSRTWIWQADLFERAA
jgi:SAM-dependent methyltransferase